MNPCMWLIFLVASTMFASYENGNKPRAGYVDGIVTMNGEPLAFANITFHPVDEQNGREACGYTDASGKYTLTTNDDKNEDGILPGEYIVIMSKEDVSELEPTDDPDPNKPIEASNNLLTLPKQCQRKEKNPLRAIVHGGNNMIIFELDTSER